MLSTLSYLNSNIALTLGYLNPALNNSAQYCMQSLLIVAFVYRNTVPKARYTNASDQTVNTECPVNTENSLRFLGICWYSCFIYR